MDFPKDVQDSGRLAAFSQALRCLIEAQQHKAADRLISRCGRSFSERLLAYPVVASHPRSSYVVRNRLRRKIEPFSELAPADMLEPLVTLLNLWCQEGRRSAVRSVLRELAATDIQALHARKGLDAEVSTMLGDFTA